MISTSYAIPMLLDLFFLRFMQRSLLSGIFIAIACSLLGMFLVLRKSAFIGEGLAHISFAGIALGLLLGLQPPYIILSALAVTLLGAFLLQYLQENAIIHSDTSIGIISYTGFALGILLISLASAFKADLFTYFFGNILFITNFDVIFSAVISLIVSAFTLHYHEQLLAISLNKDMAVTSGINVVFLDYIFSFLVAITVVIAMRIVGIILVASFMIIPGAAAMQLGLDFRSSQILSVGLSIASVVIGLLLSFFFDLASGATIVLVNFTAFAIIFLKVRSHSAQNKF